MCLALVQIKKIPMQVFSRLQNAASSPDYDTWSESFLLTDVPLPLQFDQLNIGLSDFLFHDQFDFYLLHFTQTAPWTWSSRYHRRAVQLLRLSESDMPTRWVSWDHLKLPSVVRIFAAVVAIASVNVLDLCCCRGWCSKIVATLESNKEFVGSTSVGCSIYSISTSLSSIGTFPASEKIASSCIFDSESTGTSLVRNHVPVTSNSRYDDCIGEDCALHLL